jgi:isocitrate dehydrogenase (NAD+)
MRRCVEATGVPFEWEIQAGRSPRLRGRRHPPARPSTGVHPPESCRDQGPDHYPRRGRVPQRQRHACASSLDLYANLRPSQELPGRPSRYEDVTWSSCGRTPRTSTPASSTTWRRYPGRSARRVHQAHHSQDRYRADRTRFRLRVRPASDGRRKVTAVHKANIMKFSDGLFLEVCRARWRAGLPRLIRGVRGPHR